MWATLEALAARAPGPAALRFHRLALFDAHRRHAAGLPLGADVAGEQTAAIATELAVPATLERARAAWDGPLVLVKGPEVARDYPALGTRPFGDLDLLADDPSGAQAALLSAGFVEVGDPALYEDLHHLRPLWWPGMPLVIELHSRPKWPDGLAPPPVAELLDAQVPCRVGVPGITTLAPAHHALVLAAHSWAHEPLARLGHLVDIKLTEARADAGEADALARRWGMGRLWRTTRRAADAVLGDGASAAVWVWGRHLRGARERTVLEAHVHDCLAPLWGYAPHRAPGAAIAALLRDVRPDEREGWSTKLTRTRLALGHLGVAKSEHDRSLEPPTAAASIYGKRS